MPEWIGSYYLRPIYIQKHEKRLLFIAVITKAALSMEAQVTQLNKNTSLQVVVPLKWTTHIQNWASAASQLKITFGNRMKIRLCHLFVTAPKTRHNKIFPNEKARPSIVYCCYCIRKQCILPKNLLLF